MIALNGTEQANRQFYLKNQPCYYSPVIDADYVVFKKFKVGDGATMNHWTDSHAGTVVKVTKSTVTVQRDNAELLDKPEFVIGGFAGHCINNYNLEYKYSRNEKGGLYTYSRRNNGEWVLKGSPAHSRETLSTGRHEFYDYNF